MTRRYLPQGEELLDFLYLLLRQLEQSALGVKSPNSCRPVEIPRCVKSYASIRPTAVSAVGEAIE